MQALGAARASLQSAVAARERADAQLRHANARLKVRARASVRGRGLWSGLGFGLGLGLGQPYSPSCPRHPMNELTLATPHTVT